METCDQCGNPVELGRIMRVFSILVVASFILICCKDQRSRENAGLLRQHVDGLNQHVDRLKQQIKDLEAKNSRLARHNAALRGDASESVPAKKPAEFKLAETPWYSKPPQSVGLLSAGKIQDIIDRASEGLDCNKLTAEQVRNILVGKWVVLHPDSMSYLPGVGRTKGYKNLFTFDKKGRWTRWFSRKAYKNRLRADGYEKTASGTFLITRHEFDDTGDAFWSIELEYLECKLEPWIDDELPDPDYWVMASSGIYRVGVTAADLKDGINRNGLRVREGVPGKVE
jgi:hypothetical protein